MTARIGQRFDVRALVAELDGLDFAEWQPYPRAVLGEQALPLICVGGAANFDFPLAGPLAQHIDLDLVPALRRALAALACDGALGRCRLSCTRAGAVVSASEPWSHHGSRYTTWCLVLVCDGVELHDAVGSPGVPLAAGDLWQIDAGLDGAQLRNTGSRDCVLLVVERRSPARPPSSPSELWVDHADALPVEGYRFEVLEPEQFEAAAQAIVAAPTLEVRDPDSLRVGVTDIARRWRASFQRHGHSSSGELAYRDLLLEFRDRVLVKLPPDARRSALCIATSLDFGPRPPAQPRRPQRRARASASGPESTPRFDRPLIVVSAPRSGSTLLFDLLARLPEVWTIGGESHEIIRGIPELHPAAHGYISDRLRADAATPEIAAALHQGFARRLVDHQGQAYTQLEPEARPASLRLVEKTPANALRIPFLRACFPDARFVHLVREPEPTVSSLVEGWRSRRFVAYRDLPGWPHRDWSFLLPPGWRELAERPVIEIAAYQWRVANQTILADLEQVPPDQQLRLRYAELVHDPREVLARVARFAELELDLALDAELQRRAPPLTQVTISPPRADKWRRHEHELASLAAAFDLGRDLGFDRGAPLELNPNAEVRR
ncbi:sulfotransferase [Enhygromyxa salina]|uniref:Sulfotransferase domain protein n=1 Tax=Enhygromyxa salina TaxID=215803 RepID=A0A2S9YTQ6_9BACT|nr:sulfotransferase [Enhygromyxa salina]PRQ08468.1 hypothetical protein ENSA7_17530 [Enhygromyxa salina]